VTGRLMNGLAEVRERGGSGYAELAQEGQHPDSVRLQSCGPVRILAVWIVQVARRVEEEWNVYLCGGEGTGGCGSGCR